MSSIKNWNADDRPREKLMLKGADALSNSELLAILINNGTVNRSALDLAKDLLAATQNNLNRLGKCSVKEIVQMKIKGLGEAKAITIAAALELGIRRDIEDKTKFQILSSTDIAKYLQAHLQYKSHEVFVVIYLNRANKVLHHDVVSEGGITGTIVDTKMVLRKALENSACALILCHNHPSGSLKPSHQDKELTAKIKNAAQLLEIDVLDHIIVSDHGYFSFADEGLI